MQFPATTDPVASVIVLAWRLSDVMVACLQSLRRSVNPPPYEVIIVLNGADAITRAAVHDRVVGATVVDLEANLGFSGGCNAGAVVARGRYFVFLNDDTEVEPDWLATIVESADAAPASVGAVASVLCDPDGTVQEAGCRVVRGGGTIALGHGMTIAEAGALGLLSRREIDYGAGAALLVRRDAFEQVGGFDSVYAPAYFEDVDLSFRMKQAGFATVLEPDARATHLSGASTARDQMFREFASTRSSAVFRERWSSVLAQAPLADAPIEHLCDVSLATGPRIVGSLFDGVSTATAALRIASAYAEWLRRDVERSREVAQREAELRVALVTMSPLAVLRWRLGIWWRGRGRSTTSETETG